MVWALLFAYLFTGGGAGVDFFSKEDIKRVEIVIPDPARAKAIVDQMKTIDKTTSKDLGKANKALNAWMKADRDHSLGRDQLKPVVEEVMTARQESQVRFLDALFEMKNDMSREEWEAVLAEH